MEMILASLFMIQGDCWCSENEDMCRSFQKKRLCGKEFSLFEMGECGDWCIGICRYWIFDSVRSVSVFIEGRI